MRHSETLEVIEAVGDAMYHDKFDGDIPRIKITIQKAKASNLGHCTTKPVWHDGEVDYYEINLNPINFDRGCTGVLTTLLHEFVHVYNTINGISDTSRNGTYHNAKFKTTAEEVGLAVVKTDKYGWSTSAAEQPEELIEYFEYVTQREADKLGLDAEKVFAVRDADTKAVTKKQKSFKHVCWHCGAIARTTKDSIRLVCGGCEEKMYIQR